MSCILYLVIGTHHMRFRLLRLYLAPEAKSQQQKVQNNTYRIPNT